MKTDKLIIYYDDYKSYRLFHDVMGSRDVTRRTTDDITSLTYTMRILTSEEEMREFCRRMIWDRCLHIHLDDWRNHYYLLEEFKNDLGRRSTPGVVSPEKETEWLLFLYKFLSEVIIISEEYNVGQGYLEKVRSLKYTWQNNSMIEEDISSYTDTFNDDDGNSDDDNGDDDDDIEDYNGPDICVKNNDSDGSDSDDSDDVTTKSSKQESGSILENNSNTQPEECRVTVMGRRNYETNAYSQVLSKSLQIDMRR